MRISIQENRLRQPPNELGTLLASSEKTAKSARATGENRATVMLAAVF
jgi:hypothetical protein